MAGRRFILPVGRQVVPEHVVCYFFFEVDVEVLACSVVVVPTTNA